MARPPFTDLFQPGRFYHIYNHAVGMENLFRRRDNYLYFLNRFRNYATDVCHCFAYCLMPNHFHFLIKVRDEAEIERFWAGYKPGQADHPSHHHIVMNSFSRMLNGYTQAYNKMFSRKGALFLDYMRRKQVNNQAYLINLVSYIHYNPVHHGICSDIADWEFSSYRSLLSTSSTHIARDAVLDLIGPVDRLHKTNRHYASRNTEFEF